jgi:pimeloyl-ACP methyl ester carboxylesterase
MAHRSVFVHRRFSRYIPVAAAAALLAAGIGPAAPAFAATRACGGSGSTTTVTGSLPDSTTSNPDTYELQCPAGHWNGTVFLYSHGYVVPGSANPAQDAGDPVTAGWLLSHGFALAGSSYASTGWAIQQALPDQIATLDVFGRTFGQPRKTIAWGHSLGGIITAGLIQRYPHRFVAALPMCGVLSGGIATWNTSLDSEVAFQQLIDSSVQTVNITNPTANLTSAITAALAAQKSRKGQARLALAAALGDLPGWFTPLSAEPGSRAFLQQEKNQLLWDTQVDFPFAFAFRAELEARAGGNPSWTTGVNFASQLRKSADFREVRALYARAGLSLNKDLRKLNRAPRVTAKPAAARYLRSNISFNGKLSIPVLTMHTTGDGLVIPENEQAYASVVRRAGSGAKLRQIFVSRAGHCAFTPAETITAAKVLLGRLSTGHWNAAALRPASLNKRAAALGPAYNIFASGASAVAAAPAFIRYRPTAYPRPHDLGRFRP